MRRTLSRPRRSRSTTDDVTVVRIIAALFVFSTYCGARELWQLCNPS